MPECVVLDLENGSADDHSTGDHDLLIQENHSSEDDTLASV